MKRAIIFLIIISLMVSAAFIAVSMNITNKISINKPDVTQKIQAYPVCFLLDNDIKYNTMLPFINEIDYFTMKESVAVFSPESSQSIYINKGDISSISYKIIDPLNQTTVKDKGVFDNNIATYENGYKISLTIPVLDENKRYILNLILKTQGKTVYYYQSFLVDESNQKDALNTVIKAHGSMFNKSNNYKKYINGNNSGGSFYNADENSSTDVLLWKTATSLIKMNEPIPIITDYDIQNSSFDIHLEFTVANRVDYDFEYWDFMEEYKCDFVNNKVIINDFFRQGHRKNEPYYNRDTSTWVLDEGYMQQDKQQLTSDNGLITAFVYGNEVYLFDSEYNTLKKVFGFDKLDSDYYIDEDNHHGIKLLNLDDKGNLIYMVYGYMASGGHIGYNGISVMTYNQGKNTNAETAFVKLPYLYENLKSYFNSLYYNNDYKLLYWLMDDHVYQLDLKNKTLQNTMDLSGYTSFFKDGLMYSVNDLSKENSSVKVTDLTGDGLISNILTYKGEQLRVLGAVDNQLIIGTYKVADTYEYLNGDVFYPFDSIKILDCKGNTLKSIEPEAGTYFGDVNVDINTGVIELNTYKISNKVGSIVYTKTSQQSTEYVNINQHKQQVELLTAVASDGTNEIFINQTGVSLDENVSVAKDVSFSKVIDNDISQLNTVYEMYEKGNLIDVTTRFNEALVKAKDLTQVSIFEKTNDGVRRLLFEAPNKITQIVNKVPVMAQKPELIRGCEVTSLAMFLSYYTGSNINKIDLANELRKDETPMEVVNGIINFGDMHKGFVGSIDDSSKPGLGVYIEPLYDIAKNHVDNVYDITGSSFDQVLNFVGRGMPVLVITPISYNAASNSYIKVWETESGYMEVSYQEHSVVIVGYDSNYIYLNDPDQGKLIKKPINAFKAGWISQGSQALWCLTP